MRQLNTDCEGPTCLNDNALELSEEFVPDGDSFFLRLSRYDDYLADIEKKPGYHAGNTLALIVPFLKAYGVTNKLIEAFCCKHVDLMPRAKDTFMRLREKLPIFIISTSYEQFAHSLANKIGISKDHVFCTSLDIDFISLSKEEIDRLKQLRVEIAALPVIDIPPHISRLSELSSASQKTIKRLNQIFWIEIANMQAGKFLKNVRPVGGEEKVKALFKTLKQTDNSLSNVVFIGDSITDAPALRRVKENGGLAIAFNANHYAIKASDIACMASSTTISALLVELFCLYKKEEVVAFVKFWNKNALMTSGVDKDLVKQVFSENDLRVTLVTEENIDQIVLDSSKFRESLRGRKISMLA